MPKKKTEASAEAKAARLPGLSGGRIDGGERALEASLAGRQDAPENGQGRLGPLPWEDPGGEAARLFAVAKVVNSWPEIYGEILQKAGSVKDANARRALARRLSRWEDRCIPRLIAVRCEHFTELEAVEVEPGIIKREYLIQGLQEPGRLDALVREIRPMVRDLSALIAELESLIELQGGLDAAKGA